MFKIEKKNIKKILRSLDAETTKDRTAEDQENQTYVNGTDPTPKQFEAIKQQKDIWEQGIVL